MPDGNEHQVSVTPANKIRFVTATSLFDGHDAAINIMRRLLQQSGVEVVHLGHNRSVEDIVTAAIHEDVQGIAISSYQGGHIEFFKYMIDLLRERGAGHIKVFGGGGGVIVAQEIRELEAYGVERIYSPEDGQRLGLEGMIADVVRRADFDVSTDLPADLNGIDAPGHRLLARLISGLENDRAEPILRAAIAQAAQARSVPVVGITGTGGAGKSSLTDELIRRFRIDAPDFKIAVIAIDPSRRRTGGALLGDRIRMNAVNGPIYMRSLATRSSGSEVPPHAPAIVDLCKAAGFDLVIVETPGIGQADSAVAGLGDLSLYVMTPEFGAASQLEKIDMLDHADLVAINKFDRKGGEDALRDVRKQVQRNRTAFSVATETMPVFGTVASRFNDDGVTALYHGLRDMLTQHGFALRPSTLPRPATNASTAATAIVPPSRVRYLAEIAEAVRAYHAESERQSLTAREIQQLSATRTMLETTCGISVAQIDELIEQRRSQLTTPVRALLEAWPQVKESYAGDEHVVTVRGKNVRSTLVSTSLSGTKIRKVALPPYRDHGELLRWLLKENLPGAFPFTAGVFAFKRENEDPTRMFAGEGDAFRTNARFKLLSKDSPATRLSTAFDSVTLYGCDPDERPDIYGKIGNSGVSIATLDDMKILYSGFDLCSPSTSVSMTINGPAPVILALFFNTAIDQQMERFEAENGRAPDEDEIARIRDRTLESVRGTVQADILKEDQGQNTCIFSTDFALKLMGDIQEYFVRKSVRNFYSVSISGYHIAEAGANPISQLAFTLANGFTYVETYLARGMAIDDFAPNLSFFFSNGMDPEYSVIGRVARRIWAVAMRDRYGANERSQKLKYHIQTSGRSLHAQEVDFNDIRTTLQALIAIYDNCNSLHTNAHDEAYTTPTPDSVRRAMAIQMIINREWGMARNENPNQGSFFLEELTDLVEEAVLLEFERIAERGGVLGAMETGYQRGRIQDESLYYEHKKHDGSYPIIGVNTFLNPNPGEEREIVLQRSSDTEKQSQLVRLRDFQNRHAETAPIWLSRLQQAAIRNENIFAVLIDAVRHCSLGQITGALYDVGGQYRRNM
ncbi:fused isobutyryl-CoA mutase/GTPase IcmF [Magnetospirillum molischianum]|uniref:Fused isobutyryl-CoA mutase n=1 Tax=Magnetospirillum molischianum DSM 120 TaxID=1150626 RepID=H8FQM8_MAGML|nr:fused isobutyryl-CoA mutase/GTPase IcmF [Magnetospirillum molischianum]CCG40666.1 METHYLMALONYL-COA MUTASE [Magnetospirillum molischianum DSM 120]